MQHKEVNLHFRLLNLSHSKNSIQGGVQGSPDFPLRLKFVWEYSLNQSSKFKMCMEKFLITSRDQSPVIMLRAEKAWILGIKSVSSTITLWWSKNIRQINLLLSLLRLGLVSRYAPTPTLGCTHTPTLLVFSRIGCNNPSWFHWNLKSNPESNLKMTWILIQKSQGMSNP